MSEPEDRIVNYTEVSYDTGPGEMVTIDSMLGNQTRAILRVRVELMDKMLRQAVIYELEKLGYTVISPDPEGITE